MTADPGTVSHKNEFDEAVLRSLKAKGLGEQAENDEGTETDLHFVVARDHRKVLPAILSVARAYNREQEITVYRRDYGSYNKWADIVVYPE